MSRKGECWDNTCAESFFTTLKRELAGRRSSAEVRRSVFNVRPDILQPCLRTRKSIFSGQTQYCYLECQFCVEKTFLMFFRHMDTIKMLHNYVIFYHLLQKFVIKIMKIDSRVCAHSAIDFVAPDVSKSGRVA